MTEHYYNEFEPKAAAGLKQLIHDGFIPDGWVDTRSITEVKADEIRQFTQCHFFAGIGGWAQALKLAGWPTNRPVWTGSPPCQPFSAAGKGEGGLDHRHLWPVWQNLIRECQVPDVYGEQVASAISHGWLDRVFADMEANNYAGGAAVIPACGVGAPHKRDRLWYVFKSLGVGLADTEGKQAFGQGSPGFFAEPSQCGGGGAIGGVGLAHASSKGFPLGGCGEVHKPGSEQKFERCGIDGVNQVDAISKRGCGGNGQRQDATDVNASGQGLFGVALGDTKHEGLQGFAEFQDDAKGWQEPTRSVAPPSFWGDYQWIICADGKARRIPSVESGICILDYGVPERVGLLRTGGNAIVPEVAARFIQATM